MSRHMRAHTLNFFSSNSLFLFLVFFFSRTAVGIKHHEMYYTDGSVPSMQLVSKFLKIMKSCRGAVAVHCKAGLGRTGTMA